MCGIRKRIYTNLRKTQIGPIVAASLGVAEIMTVTDGKTRWREVADETVAEGRRTKELAEARRALVRTRDSVFREFVAAARKFVDDLQARR